jgi:hypothetical protein
MSKNLKLLFANTLEDNGYKMSSANHYEKKYKNFLFCIDKDIADHMLLRLLIKNEFNETKCVKDILLMIYLKKVMMN